MAWVYPRFVFKDREAWVRFMNSDLVTGWRKQAEEASGVRVLGDITGVVRGPYRVVVSKNPVTKLEDFKGLKMRQANNRTGVLTWTALGVEVRTLPWTDTYQAIKTGIVESVTSPAALVESMRFYEVAPYVTRLDAFYQSIAFMMNGKAFDNLPKDQQQALLDAHAAASAYSHKIMGDAVTESFARMEKEGAKFSTLDPAPFVAATKELLKKWKAEGELPEGFMEAADKANAGS
jgi:TRAP-type C4-dicarboxylate transport system substrate-binding protein